MMFLEKIFEKKKPNYVINYIDALEGVNFMIEGLAYHFRNFEKLSYKLSKVSNFENCSHSNMVNDGYIMNKLKHEAHAYISRMGQFYYFANSEIIIQKKGKPKKKIPTIIKYLPYRHKQVAHRAIDWSKDEDPESIYQLNRSFSTQGLLLDDRFVFQFLAANDGLTFDIIEEHPKIIQEASTLLTDLQKYI